MFAAIVAGCVFLAAAAFAAGPDEAVPGQGPTVRIQPQIPAAPEQRIDCVGNPTDPRCRENPCESPTQIYGYDTRTCTPCLDNSLADYTNRRCACVAGFVEVSADAWGRVTCAPAGAAPPPAQPVLQDVSVPAVEFFNASASQAFGFAIVSVPWGSQCVVSIRPSAIRIEYFPPDTSVIAPTPYEDDDHSCLVRLFGAQMLNGWTFVRVGPFTRTNCDQTQDYWIEVEKRNANPADTVVDARLSSWGAGFCQLEIPSVVLNGPAGEHWKRAFGH
jgi:hypothetical protein